jgi:hypothetical protein
MVWISNPPLTKGGEEEPIFIRLRRRPRAMPVDKCAKCRQIFHTLNYCCFGGFRCRRITLRSLGVGGYVMEEPRALPVGLHEVIKRFTIE